jgi:hypothetical protein
MLTELYAMRVSINNILIGIFAILYTNFFLICIKYLESLLEADII